MNEDVEDSDNALQKQQDWPQLFGNVRQECFDALEDLLQQYIRQFPLRARQFDETPEKREVALKFVEGMYRDARVEERLSYKAQW